MKTAAEALQILVSSMRPVTETEPISVVDGLGRVLAEPVVSPIDVPAYDNSQMDGYAGVAVEMNNALGPLPVSQRIAAGHPGSPLAPGTVARIFTGAAIPSGANAVVMQEQTTSEDEHSIRLLQPVAPGQNIRPKAGDLHHGQVILEKGRRLSAADIGLCASVGLAQVSVIRRLRVAVFSSGDELRQPGEPLAFGQIYDSNRRMILALVQGAGCTPIDMGCLPDQLSITRDRLQQAAGQCDALLTCGGVSVGEEDHIKSAIASLGTLDLWKVAIKPGKPFAFGRVGEAVFMGMPGNPVAAWVTFCLLIRPALLTLAGARVGPAIGSRRPAAFDWPQPDSRLEYLRGWLDAQGAVQIHARQNSSVLSSVTESAGLVEIPASTPVRMGESVRFIPYTELFD
jgi:molybdopterin molybdotransferase